MHELYQPEFTHFGPQTLACVDRVCCSHHGVGQLDRFMHAVVFEEADPSQHRALAFGRTSRAHRDPRTATISEEVTQDPRWPLTFAAELQEWTHADCDNPLFRLRRAKVAMRSAAELILQAKVHDKLNKPCSTLSEAMATLRSVERKGLD